MTVKDALDLVVYAGALAAAVGTIALLLQRIVVRPLKKWLHTEIQVPMAGILAELAELKGGFDQHTLDHPGPGRRVPTPGGGRRR